MDASLVLLLTGFLVLVVLFYVLSGKLVVYNICKVLNGIVCICDVGMWCLNCLDLEVFATEENAFRWVFE
jgi:hypothetical protein